MFTPKMVHYVTITEDGLYHVQNYVGPYRGQHHVHTKKGFEYWLKNVDRKNVKVENGKCDCGLKAGDVREYDGQLWHNKEFE